MSIVNTDLKYYASANMPEDNTSTSGGIIDTTAYVVPTSSSLFNSLSDSVEIVSDDAGDITQTITIYGRLASGVITSDAIALNGTTVVNGVITFDRITKIVSSAHCDGTVTIRKATGDTTIASLPTGIQSIRRLFYNAAADVSGGSSRSFYEKIFIKNTHGTLALLSAVIQENSDPTGYITFDLEDAINDNNSVASRLDTAPTGMLGSFDSADKNVPGTDLGPGDVIGVWLKLTLAAGASPGVSTYTIRITGSST
jgi:hypothetical protein